MRVTLAPLIPPSVIGEQLWRCAVRYIDVAITTAGRRAGFTLERAWENRCRATGRPYHPMDWTTGVGFPKTNG